MAISCPALIESRLEYAAGTLILLARWVLRLQTLGIRAWHWDDWFSVSVFVWHSALFGMVEYLAVVGAPLGFSQEMREALTPEMRVQLEKGAKALYATFFILICFVWSAKAVLIAFFLQLTRLTRMNTYVWFTAGVAGVCFLGACMTTFLHCLPIRRNWQILPDPGLECSTGVSQSIAISGGNVLVDALLLVVPVHILRRVNMVLWRRLAIVFLLSLGLFVMAIAIARCILYADQGPGVEQSSVWVFREALVTIFAINAPVLAALFHRDTWRRDRWSRRKSTGYVHTGSAGSFRKSATVRSGWAPGAGFPGNTAKSREVYDLTDVQADGEKSTSDLVGE